MICCNDIIVALLVLLLSACGHNGASLSSVEQRMIVELAQSKANTKRHTLSIEMDSFNRRTLGTMMHWVIEAEVKLLGYTLYSLSDSNWLPIINLKSRFEKGIIKYDGGKDSFKIVSLGYVSIDYIDQKIYAFILNDPGGYSRDLLVAIDDSLNVRAVAFGAWPGGEKFDCLFYQGSIEILTNAIYLKCLTLPMQRRIK